MLSDYIEAYAKAIREEDEKAKKSIERDLSKLGMDAITARVLADDVLSKEENND